MLCGTMLVSCHVFRQERPADALVVVGQERLMPSELAEVTLGAQSAEDSLLLAERYIRSWTEEALFSRKAMSNVDPHIEQMVAAYRKQLYAAQYEEKLVQQKMDMQLPADSITNYYHAHEPLFVLQGSLVKGILLVVPNGAPQLDKLKRWLQKPETEIEKIEKYAYQYATGYELFVDQWWPDATLCRQMPMSQAELSAVLRTSRQVEVQDSVQTYILQVTDKCLPGDLMPMAFAEPEIRKILLQERRTLFIKEQKNKLYEEWNKQ